MPLTVAALLILTTPPEAAGQCPVLARWHEGLPDEGQMVIVPASNVLEVRGTDLLFNGHPVSLDVATRYGEAIAGINPRPWLEIDASKADCAMLQRAAEVVGEAAKCDPDHCFVSREPIPASPPVVYAPRS